MFVIAGVSGKVGSVAAKALLEQKRPIRVIVRDAAKGVEWAKRGAELAVGSLEDAAFLTGALQGASGFFTLLPPNYGAADFYAFQRSTADSIATAVEASRVPHVVILSSVGADLAEGNGPIRGLHYLENVLRSSGTAKLTAIRAGYFQENLQNAEVPARQLGIFPNFVPSADFPMPMIATKDIGLLAAKSLIEGAKAHEIIDLHGPAYSVRQVAEAMGARLGKTLAIVDVPAEGHVDAMMNAGFSRQLAEIFAEMYQGFSTGLIRPKAERFVQGTTTLEETLAALYP